MKFLIILLFPITFLAQSAKEYDVSTENPFGKLNPEAPEETGDFGPMIGTCDCTSTKRKADQSWAAPQKMIWTFKYIMNGRAVQDESLKEDGSHSGSIRQFIADSSKWYVHWYTNKTPSTVLPIWQGGKRGDSIVLYREQKAPNGMDGFFRLTFNDITENGFNRIGEWVNTSETFSFPTWKIHCIKRNVSEDKERILKNSAAFSQAYMNKDAEAIANFYSEDAKIFPSNSVIISGRAAIKKRWGFVKGLSDPYHKVTPSEIKVFNNYAYDYGYYEGSSIGKDGKENPFKGKYVIVWKKIENDWKIYLDIWNRL